MKSSCFYQIFV